MAGVGAELDRLTRLLTARGPALAAPHGQGGGSSGASGGAAGPPPSRKPKPTVRKRTRAGGWGAEKGKAPARPPAPLQAKSPVSRKEEVLPAAPAPGGAAAGGPAPADRSEVGTSSAGGGGVQVASFRFGAISIQLKEASFRFEVIPVPKCSHCPWEGTMVDDPDAGLVCQRCGVVVGAEGARAYTDSGPLVCVLAEEGEQVLVPAPPPKGWRDWGNALRGGLPDGLLAKVAEALVAQNEAAWAAQLKVLGWTEEQVQEKMVERKRGGNCLFSFAMVCKEWRKAQLEVGAPLRSRVTSDVILPGRVTLARWALAKGCPREGSRQTAFGVSRGTMAHVAAEQGHVELVKWMIEERGFRMDLELMRYAALGGNLELVKWLRGKGCNWDTKTCRFATRRGQLEVLQWLRANGCPWDADTCITAARYGHLETLRWARKTVGCVCTADACHAAAYGGHLEILKWLRATFCPWTAKTCARAALGGHLEVLRWARGNGCPWDATACQAAAERGDLEVLQWLRASRCPWSADTCHLAAKLGHLETLRWARENGCEWNARTCLSAAYGGHLQVLQWLRAEGCPWNKHTCKHAAEQGHVATLRWARENGCPWDSGTKSRARWSLGYTDNLGNLVA